MMIASVPCQLQVVEGFHSYWNTCSDTWFTVLENTITCRVKFEVTVINISDFSFGPCLSTAYQVAFEQGIFSWGWDHYSTMQRFGFSMSVGSLVGWTNIYDYYDEVEEEGEANSEDDVMKSLAVEWWKNIAVCFNIIRCVMEFLSSEPSAS